MLEDDHYIANLRNAHIDTSAFERELLDRLSILQDAGENEIYESVYDCAFLRINVPPKEPCNDHLVCRYLTLEKFLRFLDSHLVDFPAATKFPDRWECSVPEDYNNAILRVLKLTKWIYQLQVGPDTSERKQTSGTCRAGHNSRITSTTT